MTKLQLEPLIKGCLWLKKQLDHGFLFSETGIGLSSKIWNIIITIIEFFEPGISPCVIFNQITKLSTTILLSIAKICMISNFIELSESGF